MRKRSSLRQRLGVLLALATLAMLLVPGAAQAGYPYPAYTAQIRSASGAVMGTATFQWDASGQAVVDIQVSGFNPVAGDRRVSITNVGYCCAPTFHCGGYEIVNLPNIQFYPDGSANYHIVTTALQPYHLTGPNGSTVSLRADVDPYSAIIGCGVIVPSGGYPVPPPGPCPVPPYPGPVPPYYPTPVPPHPTPVPPPYYGQPIQVNASSGLRLRYQPSLSSGVILVLYHGEWVTPLAAPVWRDGVSWTYVQVCRGTNCYSGYAATSYLGGSVTPQPPTYQQMRVVAAAGLRLRSGAGTGYAIKRIVPNGTILKITGAEQTGSGYVWAQVYINGAYLWAAKQYLTPA